MIPYLSSMLWQFTVYRGWSGGAKVVCILRLQGVRLILAYSWARPAILVAGKSRVIPGEVVALQHQLLVCDMRNDVPPKSKRKFTPRLKVQKLKDPQMSTHFQEVFNLHVSISAGVADRATEDIWNNIKTGLLDNWGGVAQLGAPPLVLWNLMVEWTHGKGHCCQAESFQGLEDW